LYRLSSHLSRQKLQNHPWRFVADHAIDELHDGAMRAIKGIWSPASPVRNIWPSATQHEAFATVGLLVSQLRNFSGNQLAWTGRNASGATI